jgi:methyl-accepting chemotaxis protein
LIEEWVLNAETGVAPNRTVFEQLKEIPSRADQVGEVMVEITAGSEQQAMGIDQISTAVEQVNQVTQPNAATSEESAGARLTLVPGATSGTRAKLGPLPKRTSTTAPRAGGTQGPRAPRSF